MSQKVLTRVVTHIWEYCIAYEIFIFRGNDPNEKVILQANDGPLIVETKYDNFNKSSIQNFDVNITWFLNCLNDTLASDFRVNRNSPSSYTPTRNPNVQEAISNFKEVAAWSMRIDSMLTPILAFLSTTNAYSAPIFSEIPSEEILVEPTKHETRNLEVYAISESRAYSTAQDINSLLRGQLADLKLWVIFREKEVEYSLLSLQAVVLLLHYIGQVGLSFSFFKPRARCTLMESSEWKMV